MTSPDPAAILAQINAAREQTYQNIALAQGILDQANQAAAAAAQDRAAIQAIAQQTVSVDTSVGTRVFAGDTMIYGDTGWRKVNEWAEQGWDFSGHTRMGMYARRENDRVTFKVIGDYDTPSGLGSPTFARLDQRWWPVGPGNVSYYVVGIAYVGSAPVRVSNISTGRDLQFWALGRTDGPTLTSFELTWQNNQSWPTELPGTPA